MLKRTLLCLIVASICSTSQSAVGQDLFVTYGQGADVSNTSLIADVGSSGTAFLYARNGFNFDAIELFVNSSDVEVLRITGGEIFNSEIFDGALTRYALPDGAQTTLEADGSAIEFFGVSAGMIGVDTAFAAGDEDFDTDANAFLVAELNFDILSEGGASLDIGFEAPNGEPTNGILLNDDTLAEPGVTVFFGTPAALTAVAVPEPSSAALLAMGLAGLFTRRRR